MTQDKLTSRLKGGLFLSSMMNITDGAYAAERGKGTCMVQIGALLADRTDRTHDPSCLLPDDEDAMLSWLKVEVSAVRRVLGDTPIALNAAPGDLTSALMMARAFAAAGGDIFELNCHGGYGKLLERGLLRAMALPENRPGMIEWLRELCDLAVPIVVKFRASTEGVDFTDVLKELTGITRLFGIHFNVRKAAGQIPDEEFVRKIRPWVKGLLFCSGHVSGSENIQALLSAGADCVGLAQRVRDQSDILSKLSCTPPGS